MYQIYNLKCNGMTEPRGLTDRSPRFSWKLESDRNNIRQVCFRIRVWDEADNCVWDSGEQKQDTVFGIAYEGRPLDAHSRYFWQVQSFSSHCEEAVSERASFSVGNIDADWSASWIEADQVRKPITDCTEMWKIFAGLVTSSPNPEEFLNPAVCMRREITVGKPVKKAYAYATAHGIYELRIDGTPVSELLAPGLTVYKEYLEVQQYDVTGQLGEGAHALGLILADGWYTGKIGLPGVGNQYGDANACFLQIELFYEDGTRETLGTDRSFRWHESALEYADLIVGERFRQGFLDDAWELPGYDDSRWHPVVEKDYGTANFKGRAAEPVRILRTQKAASVFIAPNGELILDAGENIAGVLRIRFLGKADTVLKMTHSEVLDRDGNFLMNIMGQNKNQTDVYVCDRDGEVCWQPAFTMHGFRYVKIEGISREQLLDADVCVMGTDLERTGAFSCSDERLTQLQENIFRSQQGNMISIPTDCPQRERAGWTGDMQVYAPTAAFNMDMYSFLRKWLANMRLEQLPDGQVPNIIPSMPSDALVLNSDSEHICSAAWGDACVIIPYVLYRKYGDRQILDENRPMIEKWMQYVEKQAATSFLKPESEYTPEELERQKYLWNTEFHFGDWLYPSAFRDENMRDPVQTAFKTKEYVAPTMFVYTTRLTGEICGILGDTEKQRYYQELNAKIRRAYAEEYIDENGRLPLDLQGLYVLALSMDLYPESKKAAGVQRLAELIRENGGCLDTGFASIPFLMDTLWENGEKELAWTLLFQEACPSWLYEVKQGATTVWESWNAILPDGTRTNSSYNHFAFGCVGDFIYRRILGLKETEPGYRKVEIAPDLTCGLAWAKGSYDSVFGKISISWETADNEVRLRIILPPGVSGTVKLCGKTEEIESGQHELRLPVSTVLHP